MFDELVKLTTLEYQASVQEIEDQGTLFQRTNDLQLLAPDSCAPASAEGAPSAVAAGN